MRITVDDLVFGILRNIIFSFVDKAVSQSWIGKNVPGAACVLLFSGVITANALTMIVLYTP